MADGLRERALNGVLFGVTTLATLGPRHVEESIETLAPETIETPELPLLPLAPEAKDLSQGVYTTPTGRISICRGLLYYSHLNSVFASRRTLVLDSDNTHEEHTREHLAESFYWRPRFLQPVQAIPGHAAILRSAANNFYHTLVDNLPRLWGLHHARLSDVPIQLLVPSALQPAEKFFLDRLLPPNVRVQFVKRNSLYRPDTLVATSFLSRQMAGCLPRRWLDFFGSRVFPRRRRNKRHRIYISRRAARVGRRILNEEELFPVLTRFGVKAYELESLTLEAQIELFFDAELVVAPHGAGLTNLLFAESADVVELHPTQRLMPHYYLLGVPLGHRYRWLLGDAEQRHGDFTVDVAALERLLAEVDQGRRPR